MPKKRSPTRTDPEKYDDPLGVDEILPEGEPGHAPQVAIVTGLSDEEDARREIEKHFNPALRFCRNCETYIERDTTDDLEAATNFWCDYCGDILADVGSTPHLRKRGPR